MSGMGGLDKDGAANNHNRPNERETHGNRSNIRPNTTEWGINYHCLNVFYSNVFGFI